MAAFLTLLYFSFYLVLLYFFILFASGDGSDLLCLGLYDPCDLKPVFYPGHVLGNRSPVVGAVDDQDLESGSRQLQCVAVTILDEEI